MSGLSLSSLSYTGLGSSLGVAPAGDVSSPSESFVNPPTFLDVLDLDLMSLIPEGMRSMEDTGSAQLMRRLTVRPAELFARFQQKAWRLTLLNDPIKIPESLLDHLLAIVGFGAKSGTPARVVALLGTDEKRKLATVAVAYWKRRGRRSALEDSLGVATGIRPAIYTWFDLRSYMDTAQASFTGVPGTAPWLLPDPFVSTVEAAAPYRTEVRICGCSTSELQTLATEFCRLARPINETTRIAFVDFIDLRLDGRLGAWVAQPSSTVSGGAGGVTAESTYLAPTRTPSAKVGGVLMSGEMREGLYYPGSTSYGTFTVTAVLMPTAPPEGKFYVHLHQDTAAEDAHVVELDFDAQTVAIGTFVSGTFTPAGSASAGLMAEAFGLRVDVTLALNGTDVIIDAWIDTDLVLSETFAHAGRNSGTIAFETTADAEVLVGPVEITHPGMTITTLSPGMS
jgi:hypothetical protein